MIELEVAAKELEIAERSAKPFPFRHLAILAFASLAFIGFG
jgi:hypothetical protein